MENQDLDLIGQTVGNMPYKIGIVDKDGNLKNQFVTKASTNRIDIPQSALGASEVPQLPSIVNLFSGSAVGDIKLLGPSANYDNVQDGLLITLGNITSAVTYAGSDNDVDLSSIGLKPIKIPKEKLIIGSSFDISDQLSQYNGRSVQGRLYDYVNKRWDNYSSLNHSDTFKIVSFGGTTIKVLPNTTLNMNLTVIIESNVPRFPKDAFSIPVIQVNTYKN